MTVRLFRWAINASIFLTIFIAASYFVGLGNDATFSTTEWLAGDSRTRGRMAQDLVDRGTLIGKTAVQVRQELGQPTFNWGKVHQYHINLGWPMKNPNTYGLQMHYLHDGTVREVRIVD